MVIQYTRSLFSGYSNVQYTMYIQYTLYIQFILVNSGLSAIKVNISI